MGTVNIGFRKFLKRKIYLIICLLIKCTTKGYVRMFEAYVDTNAIGPILTKVAKIVLEISRKF